MLIWASQVALVVKSPPVSAGNIRDVGQSLGQGDSPEEGMATPNPVFILASRIPRTVEPGSYCPWGHKELDTTELHTQHAFL